MEGAGVRVPPQSLTGLLDECTAGIREVGELLRIMAMSILRK